jgi:hypothetical protein
MFFLLRYLYGLYQLKCIIHRTEKQSAGDGIIVCLSDKKIEPFSWFRYIMISKTDYSAGESAILHHESTHVLLRHSFDRTLFDLFTCFFWYNPFAWLLRRELQSVHEFQMAASPSNLDFESDLHKKYRISSDKIIVEVTR